MEKHSEEKVTPAELVMESEGGRLTIEQVEDEPEDRTYEREPNDPLPSEKKVY